MARKRNCQADVKSMSLLDISQELSFASRNPNRRFTESYLHDLTQLYLVISLRRSMTR
jgi:hypothetical protein